MTILTAGATGEINNNPRYYQRIMAKRKYSTMKRNQKIEPSVQTMNFVLSGLGAAKQIQTVDLSQCASLLNRRFYRQGINWAVAGFKVVNATQQVGASISITKLPNTWVLANSWVKSMKTWTRMNREALEETDSVRPKFLDFKIYANADHHAAGTGANLLPVSAATVANPVQLATPGEWIPSKVVVPFGPASPGNTVEFEIIATGASFPGAGASGLNAVSMIEGYAASRGLPYSPDPNTPADADDADGSTPENWMAAIFNTGTDQTSEVLEDMIFENNQAPYPFEGDGIAIDTMYPGGANQLNSLELHDFELITASTIGGTTRLKGGNFPCGLLQFQTAGFEADSQITIQVNLIPGNHRGYLCESMTEM